MRALLSLVLSLVLVACEDEPGTTASGLPSSPVVTADASSATTTSSAISGSPAPGGVTVDGVRSIAVTGARFYAARADGTLLSWDASGIGAPKPEALGPVTSVHATRNDTERQVCVVNAARGVACRDDGRDDPRWIEVGLKEVLAISGHLYGWVKSDGETQGGPIWYAVLGDGSLSAWVFTHGGTRVVVHSIQGVSKAKSVAVGEDHFCVVVEGGAVKCMHQVHAVRKLIGSDDPGPSPESFEKVTIDDAVGADGPCLRRAQGPLTCLVKTQTWAEAIARGRRAAFEEQPNGVVRVREDYMTRCMVRDDGRAVCDQPVNTWPSKNFVDVAWGNKRLCVLTKDARVACTVTPE